MVKKTIARFQTLRAPVRAMVYLHWLYSFVGALTGVFVHIYIYQLFDSVLVNAIAQAVYFFGVVIGFSGVGALAGLYRVDLKRGYLWAFIVLAGSFGFLFGDVSRIDAFTFMLANGFGLGLYWLTLHTFELTETKNDERDMYSSFLSAGDQVIDLVGPALAALTFIISRDILHTGSYTLLFIIAPFCYLLGIPFLRHLRSYRPAPVEFDDVRHFFRDKKNRVSQLYFFGPSANYASAKIAVPIAVILLLGTETRVGVFNAVFAVVSMVVILFFSGMRHGGNRLSFLFWTSSAGALMSTLPALIFTLPVYILYSLGMVVLKPLQRVSAHVIDLETMETLGRKERDFYPTMILRDVALGTWRITSIGVLVLFIGIVGEGEVAVRASFIFLALSFALQYIGARAMYRIG